MMTRPAILLLSAAALMPLAWMETARAECIPESNVPVCLAGVAIAGDYAGALIAESGKPGMRRVRKGDTVDDWKVEEIGPRYIVFSRAGDSERIDLTKNDKEGASGVIRAGHPDLGGGPGLGAEPGPAGGVGDSQTPLADPLPTPSYDPRTGPGRHRKGND